MQGVTQACSRRAAGALLTCSRACGRRAAGMQQAGFWREAGTLPACSRRAAGGLLESAAGGPHPIQLPHSSGRGPRVDQRRQPQLNRGVHR